jgi:hypothetical protein
LLFIAKHSLISRHFDYWIVPFDAASVSISVCMSVTERPDWFDDEPMKSVIAVASPLVPAVLSEANIAAANI